MKSVTFGMDEIFYVDNISDYLVPKNGSLHLIKKTMEEINGMRSDYVIDRNSTLIKMAMLIRELIDHNDIKGLVIYAPECIDDRFSKNLVCMLTTCFKLHKTCDILKSSKLSFQFLDGISNPSVNQYLDCKENWEDEYL